MIQIQFPIWKTRSIGIATYKIANGENEIEILYEGKDGKRLYPHVYVITGSELAGYPTQIVKAVTLVIVPLAHLRVKRERDDYGKEKPSVGR